MKREFIFAVVVAGIGFWWAKRQAKHVAAVGGAYGADILGTGSTPMAAAFDAMALGARGALNGMNPP